MDDPKYRNWESENIATMNWILNLIEDILALSFAILRLQWSCGSQLLQPM